MRTMILTLILAAVLSGCGATHELSAKYRPLEKIQQSILTAPISASSRSTCWVSA